MSNNQICKSCNSINPLFELNCRNCKSYLRDKVFNIDFIKVFLKLIESPQSAFRSIIFSEHKNFVLLLNLVIPVKLLIFKKWFGVYLFDSSAQSVVLIIDYLIHLTIYSSIVYIFSSILRFLTQRSNNEARLKDNYSILIYASIPYLVGAVILFPFELILFGNFLFSANPSPFVFKEVQAYLMLMFESILIIWSFLLTFFAVKVQTNKNIVSFIFSLSFNGINFLLLKVISYFLS